MGTFTTIVFVVFLALLASGLWVAIAGALVGVVLLWITSGWDKMLIATSWIVWGTVDSYTLIAVPLFIFMGFLLMESKLAGRMFSSLAPVLNHFPGGLVYLNIIAGALFAATSGSATAAAATLGTVSLPEMDKRRYPFSISAGSVAAGSVLAPIIPPSLIMIFYCSLTQQSIGREFIAGIVPGFILTGIYLVYVRIRFQFLRGWEDIRGDLLPWRVALAKTIDIWGIIALIIMVLGSIFAGIATPSEAAAVGVLGVVLLALPYRALSWQVVKKSALETVMATCQLMIIYVGISIMSAALARIGLVSYATKLLLGLTVPPFVILSLIYVLFLILGMLMESIPMMLMVLPVIYPTVIALGYDPIWFGVALTILCSIGNITPPVGVSVFVLQSLCPERPAAEIYKGMIPFSLVSLVILVIITVFPQLCLFLPSMMMGK